MDPNELITGVYSLLNKGGVPHTQPRVGRLGSQKK